MKAAMELPAAMGRPSAGGRGMVFFILLLILVAAVFLGGKAFEQVIESQHFFDSTHACDEQAKRAALSPSAWWRWNYQCRDNEGTKYQVEVKTPLGPVVLVVVVGSIGGLITLTLVTGYRKNGHSN